MRTSQVGNIFRAFQQILQDGAFQRRQFGRPALSRTRNIDGEILGNGRPRSPTRSAGPPLRRRRA
jgi:hypothetical protein